MAMATVVGQVVVFLPSYLSNTAPAPDCDSAVSLSLSARAWCVYVCGNTFTAVSLVLPLLCFGVKTMTRTTTTVMVIITMVMMYIGA